MASRPSSPAPRIHAPGILYFDAVRRAGSIREAARRLNVASSAVNRQILKMEQALDAPLFERLSAGLRLTAAGEVMARHVIAVLRDAERTRAELDALRGLRTGHVELATLEGLCHRIVPEAAAALRRERPGITVSTGILRTAEIPGAILNGDVHLGLAFEIRRQAGLRQIAAVRLPLGAIVPPGSPLARRQAVTLSDCMDAPLILPQANFANRDQIEALIARGGGLRPHYEAGSVELLKQMVLRGLGIAFMTRVGLEAELDAGSLVHVPLHRGRTPVHSELGLWAHARTATPHAVGAFATMLAAQMGARRA
ncbi:LysR family transcriptional regulator [Roseomonas sp. M0104]|uniref:LysR family transcriptional regulator n=1 Tax=Teichococcus coralli TaxID=2545983 RepID=A0A845BGX1_9PROT|nr:LysR family transcriptional regulator [Pseudoroseomonas coralli]MXP65376.1 LysR family transcriptional regulator [Pseudoroseomonas coralli]